MTMFVLAYAKDVASSAKPADDVFTPTTVVTIRRSRRSPSPPPAGPLVKRRNISRHYRSRTTPAAFKCRDSHPPDACQERYQRSVIFAVLAGQPASRRVDEPDSEGSRQAVLKTEP